MIKSLALLALFWVNTTLSTTNNQFSHFFNALTSLKADFIQTTYDEKGVLIGTISGSFIFNRPKQLRWHTNTPNEQILLLNNNELWLIDIELEQASLQKLQDLSQTPLYWLINKPNTIKNSPSFSYQHKGIDWYKANSQSSQYQQLLFGFKDKVLHAISLRNTLNQTILIAFKKALINPKIQLRDFELKLNSEFDIIR